MRCALLRAIEVEPNSLYLVHLCELSRPKNLTTSLLIRHENRGFEAELFGTHARVYRGQLK